MKAWEREIKWKMIFVFSVLKLYILHQFCVCMREGQGDFWRELSPGVGACSQPHHISRHFEKQGMSEALNQIPWAAQCADHLPSLPALSGEIFLSCCWKAWNGFSDREWAQLGWFQRWSLRVQGLFHPFLAKPRHQSSSDLTSHPQLPALQPPANAYFSTSWLWYLWTLWYEIKC